MQTQAVETQAAPRRPQAYQGDEHSLWVMNKWHEHLSFTMEGRHRDQLISLPRTWVPIDLSHHAERSQIEVCPFFRRMIASGKVEVISPEEAHKILRKEGAMEEQQRVLSGIQAVQEYANKAPTASEVDVEAASTEDIVLANIEGASEVEAINKVKLLEMQNAVTPSLRRRVLTYAEENRFYKLKTIVTEMVVSNTGASATQ